MNRVLCAHRVNLATAGAFDSGDEVSIADARDSFFAEVNRNIPRTAD
jgi:hypothetical protein